MKAQTRRTFIKTSATGGATILAGGLLPGLKASSYRRILGANDRINAAVMGVNSRGTALATNFARQSDCTLTHICDVDSRAITACTAEVVKRQDTTPKGEGDFRKVLENPDVDVMVIAAPDHWHAPAALLAMQAGKNVYVEKPCSHNPHEGEMLVQAASQYKKVVQMGNQRRSWPNVMAGIKALHDGEIGRPYLGKGWYTNNRASIGTGKETAVPEWLNWDLWQGPAPRKAFKDNYVHYNWHWFWHWGTGEINNNGLHEMDICRWALGVDFPTKVTSSGGRYQYEDDWQFYDTQVASFEFGTDKMLTWEGLSCNGLKQYDRDRGASLQGTEGSIILDRNAYQAFDKGGKLIKQVNERSLSATTDTTGIGGLDVYHMQNFIDGIRVGAKLNSPVTEGQKSVMLCHLGNIAQKFNRTLQTDARNGKILNDAEAMTLWSREYEDGWKPAV